MMVDLSFKKFFNPLTRAPGPFIGLAVLILLFSVSTPYFLSTVNAINILDQITVLGIMALGMTAVIIIGGIDLSVGSVLALSMMTMGWFWDQFSVPLPYALLIGLLVGALCGFISGFLITYAKLPAFIATLAMLSSARGLANLYTNGKQIYGYPEWLTQLSIIRHFGFLSITMVIFISLCIFGWFFLNYRVGGRILYAIGGNSEVARLAGINVRLATILVYTVSGFLSGIAGIVLAARLDSSQPNAGFTYELDVIASVVIGGASLSGGIGTIGGTLIGVFIIGVLRNGLNLLGFSPFIQQIIIGLVIVLAVSVDSLRKKNWEIR